MRIDIWMQERGYRIVLPEVTLEQIRQEEGVSHDDGSTHEYEPALTENGIVEQCLFCGKERAYAYHR